MATGDYAAVAGGGGYYYGYGSLGNVASGAAAAVGGGRRNARPEPLSVPITTLSVGSVGWTQMAGSSAAGTESVSATAVTVDT